MHRISMSFLKNTFVLFRCFFKTRSNNGGCFFAFCRKEFLHIFADKKLIIISFLIPSLQLFLDSCAINKDPKYIPTAICDNDHSLLSRQVIASLEESKLFKVVDMSLSSNEIKSVLRKGRAIFVIEIPQDFSTNVKLARSSKIVLHNGAIDPGATTSAFASIDTIVKQAVSRTSQGEKSSSPDVRVYIYNHFNSALRTTPFSVTGLISLILMTTLIFFSITSFFREKNFGVMNKLASSPINFSSMIAGKLVPYLLWAQLQFIISLLISALIFDVYFYSIFLLSLCIIPFALCSLYIGFVSALCTPSLEKSLQLGNGLFLIQLIFSGFLFPVYGMAPFCQYLSAVMPLSHFLTIIRSLGVRGASLFDVVGSISYLIAFASAGYILVMLMGRKALHVK